MEQHANESFPRTPIALSVLTALVYVAGITTVAAWFALMVLDQPERAPAARPACGVCGIVEAVRELEPAGAQQLEGSRAEGAVILLAALGGASARSHKVYETAVLHDDGSLRVLRDGRAPAWQRGDRVRVMMGRVALDESYTSAVAAPTVTLGPVRQIP